MPAVAPLNAEQAKWEWADYLKVACEYENGLGMKFVLIPPGEFMMGKTQEEIEVALPGTGSVGLAIEWIRSEGSRHKVILTQPFYFGVHEVT